MKKLTERMEKAALARKQAGLERHRPDWRPIDAAHVQRDNQSILLLASNNYLGLTHHPAVQAAAREAVSFGAGSGGARLTTGGNHLALALEQELAAFKGTEAVCLFNTGYMANVGVISALTEKGDVVFSDSLNHASLIDGCRMSHAQRVVYAHANVDELARLLAETPVDGQRFIITDGVFSMDGDIAPLPELVALAEQYDACLLVDDAHAVGVLGATGAGTASYFGLTEAVPITIGTMSKALGSEGGYAAASQLIVDHLVNTARSFIFSTAFSPATVAAARAALAVLRAEPERVADLRQKGRLFRNALRAGGFSIDDSPTPIIPLIVGDAEQATRFSQELLSDGILASAIRPPTVPVGTSRLRLSVSGAHTDQELLAAAERIIAIGRRLGLAGRKNK